MNKDAEGRWKVGMSNIKLKMRDKVFAEFRKEDVPEKDGADLPQVTPQNLNVSNIRAKVRIRKAAYEGTSKWTLVYKSAVEASIEDTEWLERFQSSQELAPPGSSLDVDLNEVYITNENGEIVGEPSYRVVKVHEVVLPPEQLKLPSAEPSQRAE